MLRVSTAYRSHRTSSWLLDFTSTTEGNRNIDRHDHNYGCAYQFPDFFLADLLYYIGYCILRYCSYDSHREPKQQSGERKLLFDLCVVFYLRGERERLAMGESYSNQDKE